MEVAIDSMERLVPYYEAAHIEAAERAKDFPLESLDLSGPTRSLADALESNPDIAVIAEHKRRSPSEGQIRPRSQVDDVVSQYHRGGATAVSVLTQGAHFGGRINDLASASQAAPLPVLRKDFISNEYQLHEAKAYGADAALLIVGGLSDPALKRLHKEAATIDLECLVEVHDAEELARALRIDPRLVGVNNRNLSTLKVDLSTADELIPQIPDGIITVAESGYELRDEDGVFSYEHIRRLRRLGADAVLMGTALMREADPARALSTWLSTE